MISVVARAQSRFYWEFPGITSRATKFSVASGGKGTTTATAPLGGFPSVREDVDTRFSVPEKTVEILKYVGPPSEVLPPCQSTD